MIWCDFLAEYAHQTVLTSTATRRLSSLCWPSSIRPCHNTKNTDSGGIVSTVLQEIKTGKDSIHAGQIQMDLDWWLRCKFQPIQWYMSMSPHLIKRVRSRVGLGQILFIKWGNMRMCHWICWDLILAIRLDPSEFEPSGWDSFSTDRTARFSTTTVGD